MSFLVRIANGREVNGLDLLAEPDFVPVGEPSTAAFVLLGVFVCCASALVAIISCCSGLLTDSSGLKGDPFSTLPRSLSLEDGVSPLTEPLAASSAWSEWSSDKLISSF